MIDTDRPAAERHALAMLALATAVYHAPNATLSAVAAAGYRAALRDLIAAMSTIVHTHGSQKAIYVQSWTPDLIDEWAAARGIDLTEGE